MAMLCETCKYATVCSTNGLSFKECAQLMIDRSLIDSKPSFLFIVEEFSRAHNISPETLWERTSLRLEECPYRLTG